MGIFRFIGWLFIIGGILRLGLDLSLYFSTGAWHPETLGHFWNEWSPNTLQLLQPAIERHLWPPLWSDVVFPLLRLPACLVFFVLGLSLLLLRRRRPERRRSRWR